MIVSPCLAFPMLPDIGGASNWIAMWGSCPSGLLSVISGLLAGGSPGFRRRLCCFSHNCGMAMFVCWFFCSVLSFFCRHTILRMIQGYHFQPQALVNWLAAHFPLLVVLVFVSCCGLVVFCFVFFLLCVFVWFGALLATGKWRLYGLCIGPCWFNREDYAIIHLIHTFATCNWTCWTTWQEPRGAGQKKRAHHRRKCTHRCLCQLIMNSQPLESTPSTDEHCLWELMIGKELLSGFWERGEGCAR